MKRLIAGLALALVAGITFAPAPAEAKPEKGGDNCWTHREYNQIDDRFGSRRSIFEQLYGIKPLRTNTGALFDGNQIFNPTNPNFYTRSYAVCGYDPNTQFIAVCVYRRGNDLIMYCGFIIRSLEFEFPWREGVYKTVNMW